MREHCGELGIFVDESGSFDSSVIPSRFYVIALLFHDQSADATPAVEELERQLAALGHSGLCIHSGPLVRREERFRNMDLAMRRRLFSRMVAFTRKAPIGYRAFCADKKFVSGAAAIGQTLLEQIRRFVEDAHERFSRFRKIKVYYDNGQHQVKRILEDAFRFLPVEFKDEVLPERYRLFQAADMLCTVELLKIKLMSGLPMTKSEEVFFRSRRDFRKDIANPLSRLLV